MSISAVNYRETHFAYPDLTRIIGCPTYDTLHILKNEIKANAISVHSNLGGGQHGNLGLVISPAAYTRVSQVPYVLPLHPGELVIVEGTTRHVADHQSRTHAESLRVFHEIRGIERTLFQQIVQAIDSTYLASARDRNTGQFNGTAYQTLHHLISVHGKISPSQLNDLESTTKNMVYDPQSPVDVVFNQVEDLIEFGDMALCPFSAGQTINIAYTIINKTRRFKDAIIAWNRRAPQDKTWINFKIHFREAHAELLETGTLTMETAGYHQANMIEGYLAELTAMFPNGPPAPPAADPPPQEAPPPDDPPAANSVTSEAHQQLLTQMQTMQAMMERLQADQANPPAPRDRVRPPSTGPRPGQPATPLPAYANKYCWTHGKCAHLGSACNTKAPGHKSNATFTNKQSGSTYGCA